MEQQSRAVLVSYNMNHMELCASAARISTTKGNAVEIFEKSGGNEKNRELIRKVLCSGHKTIIEHVIFTFALKDVSAFVEQFFIESRLASFTVKSRRYVDFSGLGYYVPPELKGAEREAYGVYMDTLFEAYHELLENGIPKEDARFLLPYSFHSNFYCTLNARELIHILHDMKYGRGRDVPELQDLAEQIMGQVQDVFPFVCDEVGHEAETRRSWETFVDAVHVGDAVTLVDAQDIGAVQMVNAPCEPAKILAMAYRVSHPDAGGFPNPGELPTSARPRELEQLSYSFLISDITLSGITHMVRHRMQSVLIPSIRGVDHSRVVLPATIRDNEQALAVYRRALECSNDRVKQMCGQKNLRKFSYYFALSGNVMDIMTTMNARELMHFMKLRTCSRAQWEIRKIAIDMLKYARASYPELFCRFGPSCFADGRCPEGAMTCGRQEEVAEAFIHLNE